MTAEKLVVPHQQSQQQCCPQDSEKLLSAISLIPEKSRIRILYHDAQIVVVAKPHNLRSVPGHSSRLAPGCRKRPRDDTLDGGDTQEISRRITAQEAWMNAIESFAATDAVDDRDHVVNTGTTSDDDDDDDVDEIDAYLSKLGASKSCLSSVPRRYKLFRSYLNRNRKRIFPENFPSNLPNDPSWMDRTSQDMYSRIEQRQKEFLNLPGPTAPELSAFGQLSLMGFQTTRQCNDEKRGTTTNNDSRSNNQLYVVHRLDCETSGVMVFARSQEAASKLSQAWRERNAVSKTYLAEVHDWPPWREHQQTSGRIDLDMAPSAQERLKWKVCTAGEGGGKPSTTLWRFLSHSCGSAGDTTRSKIDDRSDVTLLELKPITGKTHQLRVHLDCVGSGIIGDSLYGRHPTGVLSEDARLRLHAYKLVFPHPETSERVEFVVDPDW